MHNFISICFLSIFIASTAANASPTLAQKASVSVTSGSIFGNGVLIWFNGEPAVLTNHHLVSGTDAISVHFDRELTRERSSFAVVRAHAFPAGDLAILTFSQALPRALVTTVEAAAKNVLTFTCTGAPCVWSVTAPQPSHQTASLTDRMIATRNVRGEFRAQQLVEPLNNAQYVPDTFISGIYAQVLRLSSIGAPGVSGSGFYMGTDFFGIATVIHRDLEAATYAIPRHEIAQYILKRLNPHSSERSALSAAESRCEDLWANAILSSANITQGVRVPARGGAGAGRERTSDDSRGSGRTRQGGGDLGSGGDSGESALWEMEFPYSLVRSYTPVEAPIYTLNPFAIANATFTLEGKDALALNIDGTWKSATLARFCYLLLNKKSINIIPETNREHDRLQRRRRDKTDDSDAFPWLRVWRKVEAKDPELATASFENLFPTIGTVFHNGVLDLRFVGGNRELPDDQAFRVNIPNSQMPLPNYPRSQVNSQIHVHSGNHPDNFQSFLLEELQFGVRISRDLRSIELFSTPYLDFSPAKIASLDAPLNIGGIVDESSRNFANALVQEDRKNKMRDMGFTDLNIPGSARVHMAPLIYQFWPVQTASVILNLREEGALVSRYASEETDAEAVAIYDPEDITRLNRILIKTQNHVFELNRCHPITGNECIR